MNKTRPGAGNREPGTGKSDKPRILIVDDEQSMREVLRQMFQKAGYETLLAADGVSALEVLSRDFVDVVLTDIRMPRLDGVQLLQALRNLAPDVVVVMMTAHWTQDTAEWSEARQLGAAALFEKPFPDFNLVTMQVGQLLE